MPNADKYIKLNKNFDGYSIQGIVDIINKYAPQFGITTKLRMQHFLSQIAVECCEFKSTIENLNYSKQGLLKTFPKYFNNATASEYANKPEKIANKAYGNRMGNANEASGDGFKYRGRGCIQLTGKSQYRSYMGYLQASGMSVDLLVNPDLIAKPVGAIKSAMWFWKTNNINAYADKDSCELVARHINGGTNGLTERKKYLLRAKSFIK